MSHHTRLFEIVNISFPKQMYNIKAFDEVFAMVYTSQIALFGKFNFPFYILVIYINLYLFDHNLFFTDVVGKVIFIYKPKTKDTNGSQRDILDVVLEDKA